MNEQKETQAQSNSQARFSQEQYDMLLRCSEKQDVSEWNGWRDRHPDRRVLLEGAELIGASLERVNLRFGHLEHANLGGARLKGANLAGACLNGSVLASSHLEGAVLGGAELEGAKAWHAHLDNADLGEARLTGADFRGSQLRGADMVGSRLENASLDGARLEGAGLGGAHLEGAYLGGTNLQGAELDSSYLDGVSFEGADLRSSRFRGAIVTGSTLFRDCVVDRKTDFREVGLYEARVDARLRELLEYNARRLNWEDWYEQHRLLKRLARPFWAVSDYGRSTSRVIAVFFGLAFLFATTYWVWGLVAAPGVVDKLFLHESAFANFARAFYFSIVTMTTLGFGDMYAARSIPGYFFLTIQVLLGYVLLAALVTRFAILFTAGGPAGKFSKPEKKAKCPHR